MLLKDNPVFSSFSTDDVEKARSFYAKTLGLEVADTHGGLDLRIAGFGRVFLYPKKDHVPATFTVLNFVVEDIERAVDELRRRGVRFESYDLPEIKTDSRGIASGGPGPKMAWFKDPAGNILSLMQEG